MPAVAALLDRRTSIAGVRRALPRKPWPLLVARSTVHLDALLRRRRIDAIIIGADAARGAALDMLRRDFAAMPVVLYLPLRSDDADLLTHAWRERVTAVAVEGMDEPILPRLLGVHSLTARRIEELEPLAPALDLVDDLQRRAWAIMVRDAPGGLSTAELAARLGVRRETLSRGFAAGAAPSLKHAIDGVRLVAVAQLLGNRAFGLADVARLVGFSSVASLQQSARRAFGVPARGVMQLPVATIVARLRGADPLVWS